MRLDCNMNVPHINLELVFTCPHVLHLLGSLFHHQGLVALMSIDHGPPEELPSGVLKTWAYNLGWIVNDSLHVSHGERLAQKRWKITYWCVFLWWERKKRAWFYEPDAEKEEVVAQKRMRHVPPCSFMLRLCSMLTLTPCFGLDPAISMFNFWSRRQIIFLYFRI